MALRAKPAFVFFTVLLTLGLALGAFVGNASADKVHKKFKGQIITSEAPFKTSFKNAKEQIKYLSKLKKNNTFVKGKNGRWTIEYWAFLSKPLETKQAVIVFFDNTYGGEEPTEVYSTGVTPNDPYDDFVISYVELDAEFFQPDHTYEMHIKKARNKKSLAKVEIKLVE